MPSYCIVQKCNNKTYKLKNRENTSPVSFFKIPRNENLKKKWAEALLNLNKQSDPLTSSGRICAAHFSPSSFIQRGFANKRLKPDAVPSVFPKLLDEQAKVDHAENSRLKTEYSQSTSEPSEVIRESSTIEIRSRDNEEFEHPIEHSASTSKQIIPGTPTEPKICVRYPGDLTVAKINKMTPRTIRKTMNILTTTCQRKNNLIKRLRVQATRQKSKIESLKVLLLQLKANTLISPNAYNVLQVFVQKL